MATKSLEHRSTGEQPRDLTKYVEVNIHDDNNFVQL
jgi:hypothetical protein